MSTVPYTKPEDLSDADLVYLGTRIAKGPAIAALLKFGYVQQDIKQIVTKIDADAGVTGTDYEAEVLGDND